MTYKLKVSSQNQVTLPVDLLEELGIHSGDFLFINLDGEDYKIQNLRKKITNLSGFASKYVKDISKLGVSDEELEQAIEGSKQKQYSKSNT